MSYKPKKPRQNFMRPSWVKHLRVGECCVVGPCRATTVSSAFIRHPERTFTQHSMLLLDPVSLKCRHVFLVTRTT